MVLQDEQYTEIRDGLRNARRKNNGKAETQAAPVAAKTVAFPAAKYVFGKNNTHMTFV